MTRRTFRRYTPLALGALSTSLSATGLASATLLSLTVLYGEAQALSHKPFDTILRTYVRNGRVDYAGIKANAKGPLDAYVAALGKARPGGSTNAQKAFYFNAYNALVIKAVIDRWPSITSVAKVPGFFKRIRYRVAGRSLTLDQLEKEVILARYKDARTHFALVCGARSCPPLSSRAFAARGLDRVLDRLARRFINGKEGVVKSRRGFKISKLFAWYAQDFTAAEGSVGKYLAKYHRAHAAALKAASSFAHLPYDWALNKK
ncbi:MAG: hypothetical protein CSA65_09100 [Proteobacteria bacterium]|nr:MAG: hypothetical protein CSA65_09100 [Pseudomonadota bacterium]